MNCLDCVFCEGSEGLAECVCWRGADGPEVRTVGGGLCGDELLREDAPSDLAGRPVAAWEALHGKRLTPRLVAKAQALRKQVMGAVR